MAELNDLHGLLARVDLACDAFEKELKAGAQPLLENYLREFTAAERDSAFAALFGLEMDYRQKLGPVTSSEDYFQRFPDQGSQIEQMLLTGTTQQSPANATFSSFANKTDSPSRPTPSSLNVKSLGPYEMMELLGQGGMGAVYKARHTRLNRYVAIKVLPESLTRNAAAVVRFDREMKAVGALEHPNIVRAMDADTEDGTHYLVMEFVDGQDLQKLVKEHGQLPIVEACRIIRDTALALDHAHRHGMVHRDIKPSNLLLTTKGQLKVLDLGLAKLVQDDGVADGLTNTGASLGTPDYMSPEQWTDPHTADQRTDLYALGCTLYYLLVGRPPYGTELYRTVIGKMTAHVQGLIPSLREARPDVPAELEKLYQQLMVKNRDERWASAEKLATALEPFCPGSSPQPDQAPAGTSSGLNSTSLAGQSRTLPKTGSTKSHPEYRRKLLVAAGGLGGVLAVLLGIWVIIKDKDGKEVARVSVPDGETEIVQAPGPAQNITVPTPATPIQDRFALSFDWRGEQRVELPFGLDPTTPVTIEAWIHPKSLEGWREILGDGSAGVMTLRIEDGQIKFAMTGSDNKEKHIRSPNMKKDGWTHLAVTYDQKTLRLFIDGREAGESSLPNPHPPSNHKLVIGLRRDDITSRWGSAFFGEIREIRFSRSIRYDKQFEPAQTFLHDNQTLALYHFDEGTGDVLNDSSGNDHHGKIVGAKWVKVENAKSPAGSDLETIKSAPAP